MGNTSASTALLVCEALHDRRSGALHFIGRGGSLHATIAKRYTSVFVDESTCWLGLGKSKALSSRADLLGATLLANAGAMDPTLSAVSGLAPPMRYNGGYNKQDPAHGGRAVVGGGHTFVGSRAANVDAVFDYLGGDTRQNGYPSMDQWPGKYQRSKAIFKDPIVENKTLEGLWGGHLPIVSFTYTIPDGFIEWTAVPVEDDSGSIEQRVFFRLLKLDATGAPLDARFYDTYAYNAADTIPAHGQPAGSKTAAKFYDAVLAQQEFWSATMEDEGTMEFELPDHNETDGELLRQQALHSIVRDMITRTGGSGNNGTGLFPKYGVTGTYTPPNIPLEPRHPTSTDLFGVEQVSTASYLETGSRTFSAPA